MSGRDPTETGDPGRSTINRRTVLRTTGAAAVGLWALGRTTATPGAATAAVAIEDQRAVPDPPEVTIPERPLKDDFPVADAFVVDLPVVDVREPFFEGEDLGPVALPVKNTDGQKGVGPGDTFWHEGFTKDGTTVPPNTPAFVVGLHSPDVGDGQPDSLSSLIGVRPVAPGLYQDLSVPVWAGPPPWQRSLGAAPEQFPEAGDEVEVTATVWYGPDVFPPTAARDSDAAIAQTPEDETNGPVTDGDGPVSAVGTVSFATDVTDTDGDGVVEREEVLDAVEAYVNDRPLAGRQLTRDDVLGAIWTYVNRA